MTGFRDDLHERSKRILDRLINGRATISPTEGRILRELWECSRAGNLLLETADEVNGFPVSSEIVGWVLWSPGFLTQREAWHAVRLRNKAIVVYRGCVAKEVQDADKEGFGMSWTLDRRVAEFFASRNSAFTSQPGVVITAKIYGGVWLDTPESEVIAPNMYVEELLAVEPAGKGPAITSGDWKNVKPIYPSGKIYAGAEV